MMPSPGPQDGRSSAHRASSCTRQTEGMRTTPRSRRSRPLLALVLAAIAALATGCGGGGEVVLPAPKESDERPAPDDGDGSASEYCAAVAELEATDDSEMDDPAKAVESLAVLGGVAPDELKPSFEVLADVVGELAGLDESDPDYLARSLEIVFDPSVQEAAGRIDEFTIDECGIDLDDSSDDPFAEDPSDGSDSDAGADEMPADEGVGDIDLEHIDGIKEANSAASWSSKLRTTTITNDTYVTLAADPTDPVTAEEAMAACEAIRTGVVSINPQVTVEIRNGEVAVAASPDGGTCSPR